DAYEEIRHGTYWRGHHYQMVKPWLDHPPLYSLYVGAWMLAQGDRKIFEVDLWKMRTGTVPLAVISFVLLTLILRRLLSPPEVLLALLFYTVLPSVVFHQRLVVCENLYVPFTLGVVLMLLHQRRNFSWLLTGGILLVTALLPMTKVAALSTSVFL